MKRSYQIKIVQIAINIDNMRCDEILINLLKTINNKRFLSCVQAKLLICQTYIILEVMKRNSNSNGKSLLWIDSAITQICLSLSSHVNQIQWFEKSMSAEFDFETFSNPVPNLTTKYFPAEIDNEPINVVSLLCIMSVSVLNCFGFVFCSFA